MKVYAPQFVDNVLQKDTISRLRLEREVSRH